MLNKAEASQFSLATQSPPAQLEYRPVGNIEILISGRNREGLDKLVDNVMQVDDVTISTRHISNGHSDPLYGAERIPDLLILRIGEQWREELIELVQRPPQLRPALIVVADTVNQDAMRLAMKAGAMDYLAADENMRELRSSVLDFISARQQRQQQQVGRGSLVSVINAKGGSGGSIIASNLAHLMCDRLEQNVALVDLDLQFGSLCHYLDMQPKYGIVEVLQNIYELDRVALQGYMLKHASGLSVLDVKPGSDLDLPGEEQLDALIDLLVSQYDQVVVDVPRSLSSLNRTVLERSDRIIVVLQQSISHLRDAKRLLDILVKVWGLDGRRITVVINRFEKRAELTVSDISKAIGFEVGAVIPNAFAQVNAAVNEGVPVAAIARKSPLTRAMLELSENVLERGQTNSNSGGLLGRVMKNLKGA